MFHANLLRSGRLGIVLMLNSLAASPALSDESPPCANMKACIRAIPTIAAGSMGITQEEQRLAEAINAYGGAAVPELLPYLKDTNKGVRELTSFILRSQPGLREEDLPALMESRLRGDGWIPPAIARIGTPKAIAFLVNEMKKEPEPQSQLTWAFKVLGPKAGPPLVKLYRCGTQCDGRLLEACESIFGELKDQAGSVVPDLKAIALDETQPLIARRAAVTTLGAIGPSAAAAPDLQSLAAKERADFGEVVDQAFFGMRHPAAVDGILKRIEQGNDIAFVDLAEMGRAGQVAGPTIVKYLSDPHRAVRAARTFGYIGYAGATEELVHLLHSEDWRKVYVSCESLGQLKAADARAELERVMTTHWYPPVRDAAKAAILSIEGKDNHHADNDQPLTAHFFAFEHAGENLCQNVRIGEAKEANLNVQGGRLVGTNHGEFGGELHFVDGATKREQLVLKDNIMGIFQLGSRLVAVGGLAHLMANEGTVYEIKREGDHYSANVWRHLPGAPRIGKVQKDGRLLVYTYGGPVFLSEDGTMEMAPCHP